MFDRTYEIPFMPLDANARKELIRRPHTFAAIISELDIPQETTAEYCRDEIILRFINGSGFQLLPSQKKNTSSRGRISGGPPRYLERKNPGPQETVFFFFLGGRVKFYLLKCGGRIFSLLRI